MKSIEVVDEEVMETKISWDVGKTLGLPVSNEGAMIAALAKVQEIQDFTLLRKRGRPRKNKSKSKN